MIPALQMTAWFSSQKQVEASYTHTCSAYDIQAPDSPALQNPKHAECPASRSVLCRAWVNGSPCLSSSKGIGTAEAAGKGHSYGRHS